MVVSKKCYCFLNLLFSIFFLCFFKKIIKNQTCFSLFLELFQKKKRQISKEVNQQAHNFLACGYNETNVFL